MIPEVSGKVVGPFKNNSLARSVYEASLGGSSLEEIAQATGLPIKRVTRLRSYLAGRELLKKNTPEETRALKSRSVSEAKGGVANAINEFITLGMLPREIEVALAMVSQGKGNTTIGKEISHKQIVKAVKHYRQREHLKLTSEDREDSVKLRFEDEEIVRKRVADWLMVRDLLVQRSIELPNERSVWTRLILKLDGKDQPQEIYRVFKEEFPWIEIVELLNSNKVACIPEDKESKDFLISFFTARKKPSYQQENVLAKVVSKLRSLSDEQRKGLKPAISIIRDATADITPAFQAHGIVFSKDTYGDVGTSFGED